MKYTLTFAFMASLAASSAFAAFKAPLPEFKNEKQLAEMRAAQSSKATSQGYKSEETAFYTGKPYLSATESYAFKYRNYAPELARWTSEDPSGFPDGANGSIYGINNPILGFDPDGLEWKLRIAGPQTSSSNREGIISIGGYSHRMDAGVLLTTNDITATSTGSSGTVRADFLGLISKMNGTNETFIDSDVSFSISVNGDGLISIIATGGGYDNANGNLQIGGSWSKDIGSHTATLTFASASVYGGSGLTGIGFQANGAFYGGSASATWTNPTGKVSAFTTLSFYAYE